MLLPVMAVLAAAVLASLPSAAVATNYTVGDEKGWNPKVDYTSWVKKHRPFYTGDWLRKPTLHISPPSRSASATYAPLMGEEAN